MKAKLQKIRILIQEIDEFLKEIQILEEKKRELMKFYKNKINEEVKEYLNIIQNSGKILYQGEKWDIKNILFLGNIDFLAFEIFIERCLYGSEIIIKSSIYYPLQKELLNESQIKILEEIKREI
jgi:Icc-related predicted phosphoesterase